MNRPQNSVGRTGHNPLREGNITRSSEQGIAVADFCETFHAIKSADCLEVLKSLPDNSIQLIICDPPYNIDIASWDRFTNYIGWAKEWLRESERVLTDTGSMAIFGGCSIRMKQVVGISSAFWRICASTAECCLRT